MIIVFDGTEEQPSLLGKVVSFFQPKPYVVRYSPGLFQIHISFGLKLDVYYLPELVGLEALPFYQHYEAGQTFSK